MADPQIKFSTKDAIASLVIGEIVAWLLIAMIKNLNLAISSQIVWSLPVVFPILCIIGLYIAYLISKKIPVIYQVAKFVLVGGLNTLMDWGVLAFLIILFDSYLGIKFGDTLLVVFSVTIAYYSLYKSISFIVASINSYLWNKFWTFQRQTTEKVGREFIQFFVITVIGFLLNVGIASIILKLVTPIGGLPDGSRWPILAAVIATAFSMVWNFVGYKFIVFNVGREKNAGLSIPSS
jgi:putative flippase GtrA